MKRSENGKVLMRQMRFWNRWKKDDSLLVKNNNYLFYKGLSLTFEAGEKT